MKTQYITAAILSALMLNPLSAGAEGKDGVAAVVNGDKITVSEIRKTYESAPQIQTQATFEQFYPQAVTIWANSKALQSAAQKSGVENSEEYKQQLEAIKADLLGKVYLKQEIEKRVSDNDIRNFYNQYKKDFKPQKEMRAHHILVDNEDTAEDIITKIKKGDDFNELAKKYSKEKNADLGYFTKDMMVPEFGEVAFKMKKGEYTKEPIKTKFGYHIIKVDDVRDSKPVSYEDAKEQIRARLAQEKLPALLNEIVANAKIEKYQLDGKLMPNTPAVPTTPADK